MSKTRSCVGILFIISVIIGILLGYMVLEGIGSTGSLPEITPKPYSAADSSGQGETLQTVLVIGVDSLEKAAPALEGAWVVSLEQTNGESNGALYFEIATLYPVTKTSVLSTRHGQYAEPHDVILIEPGNFNSLTQLAPIAYFQGEWTDIIVIDEVVVNMLIALHNPNTPQPIPTPHHSLFIKPWEYPEGAFQQQRAILTTLCDHPDPLSEPAVVLEILAMFGQHLTSTMTNDSLLDLWQVINYTHDKQIVCSFYPE